MSNLIQKSWTDSNLGGPKGLLDNQNPGFCMGWPGLYLLDSIEHSPDQGDSRSMNSTVQYIIRK